MGRARAFNRPPPAAPCASTTPVDTEAVTDCSGSNNAPGVVVCTVPGVPFGNCCTNRWVGDRCSASQLGTCCECHQWAAVFTIARDKGGVGAQQAPR
jgi:hypothetical protein